MPPERPLSALLLMAIDSVRSERQLRERVDNRLLFRGFLDRRFLDMSPAGRGDNFLASGRIYERLQSGGYPSSQRVRKNIEEGSGGLKTIAGRKPCARRNPCASADCWKLPPNPVSRLDRSAIFGSLSAVPRF